MQLKGRNQKDFLQPQSEVWREYKKLKVEGEETDTTVVQQLLWSQK